jgi:hypothetical protein
MAGEEAMHAIKNLGELEEIVRPMIQNATILSDQRKQTYEALNRLREIAQVFLGTYEGNRNNLDGLYRVIKSEAEVSSQKQRDFLQQVAKVLEQALTDPTQDAVKVLIGDVDRLIEQMREKNSQPSTRAQVNQQISLNNVGTLRPPREGPMPLIMPPPDSDSKPVRDGRPRWINYNPRPGGLPQGERVTWRRKGGRSKKIRRPKRGGYSWRTPSPNKSRKKTPTYKKTIKKTRTRQN